MTTILITGCSSGFGLETARYFLERGWNVVATMREPREDILPASERLKVLPLDVTDEASIAACLEAAAEDGDPALMAEAERTAARARSRWAAESR